MTLTGLIPLMLDAVAVTMNPCGGVGVSGTTTGSNVIPLSVGASHVNVA
jgi:hypothetical protein